MAEKRYGGKVLGELDKANKYKGLSDGLHFPTMKSVDSKSAGKSTDSEQEEE